MTTLTAAKPEFRSADVLRRNSSTTSGSRSRERPARPSSFPAQSDQSIRSTGSADASEGGATLQASAHRDASAPMPSAPMPSALDSTQIQDVSVTPQGVGERPAADPSACCANSLLDLSLALRQALIGSVSASGFLLFSKDISLAILQAALVSQGYDVTEGHWPYVLPLAAGLWYGACQQVVARSTYGLLNYGLGVARYAPHGAGECERQKVEFLSQTLPAIGAYTLCHTLRGCIFADSSGIVAPAFQKLGASIAAGGLAGAFAEIYRQKADPRSFKALEPESTFQQTFCANISKLCSDMNAQKLGRDYIGRALAGGLGFLAGSAVGVLDILPKEPPTDVGEATMSAFLNRLTFQTIYSTAGSHLGAAIGYMIDRWRAEETTETVVMPHQATSAKETEVDMPSEADIRSEDDLRSEEAGVPSSSLISNDDV